MKALILVLTIAGVASTAPLNAQILGTRLPTPSTTRGTSVDGSWRVVGQDRSGTIYERRTYDANGNIIVQRARRDANGNFSILSARTVQGNNNGRDCQLASTNTTVGGIILGRSGTTDCRNDRGSVDGVWRQVGRGRNNNSVYERRTLDAYGNVVVQKARRNSNGTFTILSTRTVGGNRGVGRNRGHNGDDDDQGDNEGRDRGRKHDDDDRYDNSTYNNGSYDYNNGSYDYNNGSYNAGDARYGKSEHKSHGRGKGRKGRD